MTFLKSLFFDRSVLVIYNATIQWGDGAVDSTDPQVTTTTNPVSIVFNPSNDTYNVKGTHTYASPPTNAPTVHRKGVTPHFYIFVDKTTGEDKGISAITSTII